MTDTILFNGKITTMDPAQPDASAVAIAGNTILEVGSDADILRHKTKDTQVIDLEGQRVIPGLIDSHTHIIRQGNNFAMELRWDHVPSLADGLRMLKAQAERTPAGQWIRVVGGWSADQFAEKRLPTLEEINKVAPDVPVYVLHLYDRAWLNKAALRALGIDKHFYEPFVSGRLERDDQGNPTGLAMARPNAQPLYALLDMAPKLDFRTAGHLDQALFPRPERSGSDLRARLCGRVPELPGRLWRHLRTEPAWRTNGAHWLSAVRAKANVRTG